MKKFILYFFIIFVLSSIVSFFNFQRPVKAAAPTNGLIGYWNFDEGSGTVAADSSATGNQATITGSSVWMTGRVGNALTLSGTANYVSAGSQSLGNTFSFAVWVNNPSHASNEMVLSVGNNRAIYLRNGVLAFYDGAVERSFDTAVADGSWQHIAVTYDGTNLRGYLNGVQTGADIAAAIGTYTGNVFMGAWAAGTQYFYSGSIDEARIYNRSLSAQEVLDVYQDTGGSGTTPPPSDTTPPVVSLTSPSSGATVSGSSVTLTASASDNVGVAGVQFLLDGANLGTEDTTAPYYLTWDTTTAANGTHTLSARASDTAGNQTTSAIVSVTVDNATTPPPSGGTVYGMTIPAGHPRLWFNSSNLAQARAWYQANPNATSGDPNVDGAYRYLMTGDPSYCAAPVDWALNVPIESSSSGTSSNGARWYGEQVALIWDWCYDAMSITTRQTIMNNWNNYNEIHRNYVWGGPSMMVNNYFWGYFRNMLMWAIASYGENPAADTFFQDTLITRWQNSFVPYAANQGRGGVPNEGHQYGRYLLRYGVVPFRTAGLYGRNIYNETNYFKEAVFYMIYGTTPQPSYVSSAPSNVSFQTIPFSDDQFWRFGGNAVDNGSCATSCGYEYGDYMTYAANIWGNLPIGQYARQWINMVQPRVSNYIRSLDQNNIPLSFNSLPLDYFAPGIGMLYGRNQWGTGSTIYHLMLGDDTYGSGHNHSDMGTFQIWRNGRWLSRETTAYTDTLTGYNGSAAYGPQTELHNGILINGIGSLSGGSPYTSSYHGSLGPARVLRLESRPEYSFAVTNLTDAYRGDYAGNDNPAVANIVREFLFIRPLETMVIFDRLESNTVGSTAAANIPKTFIAHFETNPTVDQTNRVVTAVNGSEALRITTLLPANPTYRPIVAEGGTVGQYRLELETSGSAQSYFLNILQAKGVSDPNLTASVVDNGASYSLTLSHPTRGTVTITFNKGMTSTGGSIVVGGQSYNFLDRVQSISVTDNGPMWESLGGGTIPPPTDTTPPEAPRGVAVN